MNAPSPSESTAIAVASRQQFDLSPQTFEQALTFSEYLAASEMVPKQFRNKPGDCLVAMQWGYEVGLKPLQALQGIAVINGKPGIFGDVGKAILLNAGCIIEEDDTEIVKAKSRGRCKITRPGRPPVERTFSLDDAKTAGLWNKEGPWKTYPFRQMAWRAFWFAARDAAADLLRGLSGAEELMDHPAGPRDMGAADVVGTGNTATGAAAQATGLPAMTDEDFAKREAKVREFYGKGKTPDEVIAFYATKFTMPAAIQKQIRDMAAPAADGDKVTDVQPKDGPKVTYAGVAESLNKAANTDELAQAAILIAAVPDEQQRVELTTLYETLLDELKD